MLLIFFQALQKMKDDWGSMLFSFVPYKDTGINIMSAPDEIQVLPGRVY
jgi:hypothetical protein